MKQYRKTKIANAISVQSIVTIHYLKLCNHFSPCAQYDFPHFIYVESGEFSVDVDKVSYTLHAGEGMIYAPYSIHRSAKYNTAIVGIISFEAECESLSQCYNRIIPLRDEQGSLFLQIVRPGAKLFERHTSDDLVGMQPKEDTDAYQLQKLKNQLELLLIDILHTEKKESPLTDTANHRNFQKEQFAILEKFLLANVSRALTLDEICEGCSIGISSLKRLCQAQCGMSPAAYFSHLKTEEAKKLIRESSLNMTQIAEALGYGSVHHFSKSLKDKVGMTPTAYAKSM